MGVLRARRDGLRPIVGDDAARFLSAWPLLLLSSAIVNVAVVVPVLALSSNTLIITLVCVLNGVLYATALMVLLLGSRAASQHLTAELGFRVRAIGAYSPDGWRRFIAWQRRETGSTRPRKFFRFVRFDGDD